MITNKNLKPPYGLVFYLEATLYSIKKCFKHMIFNLRYQHPSLRKRDCLVLMNVFILHKKPILKFYMDGEKKSDMG